MNDVVSPMATPHALTRPALPMTLPRDPAGYRPHALHDSTMVWKQTNCYVDLWIELLSQWGFEPHAMLPFTVTQDFEGDQFTFFKVPLEDLERLYGIVVQEHAIFEPLPYHIGQQVRRGNVMLVEVDAWHLPDTRGISYQREHTKTTIGIDAIDLQAGEIGYFHNAGYYRAAGDDYRGLFDIGSSTSLAPYVECAKRRFEPLRGPALHETALSLLTRHFKRRPASSPIAAFRAALAKDAAVIASRPISYFHSYSFNTLRQLGANFELLGRCLRWLDAPDANGTDGNGAFTACVAACNTIASEAMVLEFRLARACARRNEDRCESTLETIEHAYGSLIDELGVRLGDNDAPPRLCHDSNTARPDARSSLQ